MKFIRNILNSRSKRTGIFLFVWKIFLDLSLRISNFTEKHLPHRSMNIRDGKGIPINYERLEFVGDAMLSSVIATHLYNEVPQGDEGYLTKMRSKIVSREHLNELGRELSLIDLVISKIPKGNFGNNIHGNLFEALVGAIFLDKGYSFCEKFIYDKVYIHM